MARKTYKTGGAGKHGQPPKACTICNRHHPKGKKQKKKAMESGWMNCKEFKINRKSSSSDSVFSMSGRSFDSEKREAKNMRKRIRHAEDKASNISRMNNRVIFTPSEQISRLDARLGKGVGATKERTRLIGEMLK